VSLNSTLVALNLKLTPHVLLVLHLRRLTLGPVEFVRHVGNCLQVAIRLLKNTFQVILGAVGSKWTKSEHVVFTNCLFPHVVKENTVGSDLAKASLPIRTLLTFLGVDEGSGIMSGVSVNALLVGAISLLLPELTNRHFRFVINVQKVTIVTPRALLLEPVDADELLPLRILHIIVQALIDR